MDESGIAGGHAYSLLSTHTIKIKKNNLKTLRPVHLVKLRNPWGNREWNGAWSDTDEENWSCVDDTVRQQIGYSNEEEDGIFFMEISDYKEFFNLTAICAANVNEGSTSQILDFP